MEAGPKGEAGGRRRRAVEVLSGPDSWNKQRTGLAEWPLRQRPIGCGRKPCPEVHFRGIPVDDLDRAPDFCTKVLGMEYLSYS
jgi:hypothetical protein